MHLFPVFWKHSISWRQEVKQCDIYGALSAQPPHPWALCKAFSTSRHSLIWKPEALDISSAQGPWAPLYGLSASSRVQRTFPRVAVWYNLQLVTCCEWHTLHKSPSTEWQISLKPDICWASPEGKGSRSNHRVPLQGPAGGMVALRQSCHLQLSPGPYHFLQPWRALHLWGALPTCESEMLPSLLSSLPPSSQLSPGTTVTSPWSVQIQHGHLYHHPMKFLLTLPPAQETPADAQQEAPHPYTHLCVLLGSRLWLKPLCLGNWCK